MKISKSFTAVIVVVLILVLVALGVWVGMIVSGNRSAGAETSPYSAVYLSTGDVYFGKLDWFPTPHIEDAWFLQRGTDAKGNPTVGVYPFSQIAWGPAGDVYLNAKQIIFWTGLSSTSTIAQAIENPDSAAAAAEQQSEVSGPQVPPPATSSTPQ